MRIWFDTEFIDDGKTIELLSIGLVRADGCTYYAEPSGVDTSRAHPWVQQNVIPHLHGSTTPRDRIAVELVQFCGVMPEFWAYYGSYDWVALCQLFGTMLSVPPGWPHMPLDVKQLCVSIGNPKLPVHTGVEHNALDDARWTQQAWEFCMMNGAR